ncbi:hypothetical protein LEMLEM_LOCUS7863, partial [Lemmus lemmus]
GELQDLGAAVQRSLRQDLWVSPRTVAQAENCRAVFTCILATARAGAWVPMLSDGAEYCSCFPDCPRV